MSLSPGALFVSMVASAVGFGLFIYGKKQARWPQLAGGLALMIYPYFVDGLTMLITIGLAICAATYWAIQSDY